MTVDRERRRVLLIVREVVTGLKSHHIIIPPLPVPQMLHAKPIGHNQVKDLIKLERIHQVLKISISRWRWIKPDNDHTLSTCITPKKPVTDQLRLQRLRICKVA